MSTTSYGPLEARYYDPTYERMRDPSGDTGFYLSLAQDIGGPVLELGCGTGRVLLPIARAGIEAVGLDQAPEMLATFAAKELPPTLRLVPGTMTDFDLDTRFKLVFSAFRAFQHLTTVEEQLACLACVRRHLAPGGVFAFDVFFPDLRRLADPEGHEWEEARFPDGDAEVTRYARTVPDPATQVVQVRFRYVRRRGDEVLSEHAVDFTLRWFYRYEVEHLLARAGFETVACYGTFDKKPFDKSAREIITVARVR